MIDEVLIRKINEKAMDLYGDILIDESVSPPVIFDEYLLECEEVVRKNERYESP